MLQDDREAATAADAENDEAYAALGEKQKPGGKEQAKAGSKRPAAEPEGARPSASF